MAKYERSFKGDFQDFLNYLHGEIMNGSYSISFEDGSDIKIGNSFVAVRVYERYSLVAVRRCCLS